MDDKEVDHKEVDHKEVDNDEVDDKLGRLSNDKVSDVDEDIS